MNTGGAGLAATKAILEDAPRRPNHPTTRRYVGNPNFLAGCTNVRETEAGNADVEFCPINFRARSAINDCDHSHAVGRG